MNQILTSATFGEASRSSLGSEKPALTAPRVCFLAPSLLLLSGVISPFFFAVSVSAAPRDLWKSSQLPNCTFWCQFQSVLPWKSKRNSSGCAHALSGSGGRLGVHATGFRWQALNQKTSLTARAVPFCTSLLFSLPNHVPQFVFEICCVSWQIGRWLVSRFGSSTEFSVVLSLFTPLLSCYKPRFERWWVPSRWSWVDFRVCLPYVAHSNHAAEIVSNSLPLIRHIKNPAKSVPSALTASADFKMPKVLRQRNP